MSETKRTTIDLPIAMRKPGDAAFAVFCLLIAVFLLSQLGEETKWVKGASLLAQPRFWPGLSAAGMAVFAAVYLFGSLREQLGMLRQAAMGEEVFLWVRSLEFALWFMVYVFATPVIGYLAATVVFCVALARRVGYANARVLGIAAGAGALIVLGFKTFLQVKIPGGAVYEYLPDAARNFFILNF